MQTKAFRLNKYENCGLAFKYFDLFELDTETSLAIGTFNCMVTRVWDLNSNDAI